MCKIIERWTCTPKFNYTNVTEFVDGVPVNVWVDLHWCAYSQNETNICNYYFNVLTDSYQAKGHFQLLSVSTCCKEHSNDYLKILLVGALLTFSYSDRQGSGETEADMQLKAAGWNHSQTSAEDSVQPAHALPGELLCCNCNSHKTFKIK